MEDTCIRQFWLLQVSYVNDQKSPVSAANQKYVCKTELLIKRDSECLDHCEEKKAVRAVTIFDVYKNKLAVLVSYCYYNQLPYI